MNPRIKEILAELSKTSYGQALNEYLDYKYDDINDVHKIKSEAELIGHQIALKLLDELFGFLGDKLKAGKSTKPRYD